MRSDPGVPEPLGQARRRFLASCGKFALATPPVVTLMLADAERNYAVAQSGGVGGGGGGGGKGHHHGHHHGHGHKRGHGHKKDHDGGHKGRHHGGRHGGDKW